MERRKMFICLIAILMMTNLMAVATPSTTDYRMKDILEGLNHITSNDVNISLDGFPDMTNHWSRDSVGKLTHLEIIKGYPDGTFRPNQNIQVDEFIKLTVTAMGYRPEAGDDYWAEPFIKIAKGEGLIEANEFTNYRRPITRAEMAKIIVNATMTKEEAPDDKLLAYLRSKIRDYQTIDDQYKHHVLVAYGMGLIGGYPDGTFRGNNYATRAEASAIILRFLDESTRNKNIVDAGDAITLRNNLTGEYETIYPPHYNPEAIRIANALKDAATKSKGYAEPFYSGYSGGIVCYLYEKEEHRYADDPRFIHGSIIIANEEDRKQIPYQILINNIEEMKRLHHDVVIGFFKALFESDADKAIAEYEKYLDLALEDNNGFRKEVIINDRRMSFFKDGADKGLSINIGIKGFRRY